MFSDITPELVSQIFPFTPVPHIAANLPAILDALQAKDCGRDFLIMALATIRAEAESFQPLLEMVSRFNTPAGGPPFSLYDHRSDLGNQGPPDGERFRGRGYVQLTGRANYAKFGPLLNLDLVANPELAAGNQVAARLLVEFLCNQKQRIEAALAKKDLAAARRLVNGGIHGLDRFTDAYQRASRLIV